MLVFTICPVKAAPGCLFLHDFALAAVCDIGDVGSSSWGSSSFGVKPKTRHLNNSELPATTATTKTPKAASFKSILSTSAPCWTDLP